MISEKMVGFLEEEVEEIPVMMVEKVVVEERLQMSVIQVKMGYKIQVVVEVLVQPRVQVKVDKGVQELF